MPSNYLYFVSTHLVSIPEEIHCCNDENQLSDPIRASVHRSSSSSSFDSTASPSLVPMMRNWLCDEAKSSSFMPKVPTRRTEEYISNDTAPKAPLRRRLSEDFGAECDIPIVKNALEPPLRKRLSDDVGAECDFPVVKTCALLSNEVPLSIPYERRLVDPTFVWGHAA
jgi:hypothetical protein